MIQHVILMALRGPKNAQTLLLPLWRCWFHNAGAGATPRCCPGTARGSTLLPPQPARSHHRSFLLPSSSVCALVGKLEHGPGSERKPTPAKPHRMRAGSTRRERAAQVGRGNHPLLRHHQPAPNGSDDSLRLTCLITDSLQLFPK